MNFCHLQETASKKAVHMAAEATAASIGNKIADEIMKF